MTNQGPRKTVNDDHSAARLLQAREFHESARNLVTLAQSKSYNGAITLMVKSLDELLGFLKVGDCLPQEVSAATAIAYVDMLNEGDLSHATKKGKASCLGRLWKMKKVTAQLPKGAAIPWVDHDVKGERKSTDEVSNEEAGRPRTDEEIIKVFSAPDVGDKRKRTYPPPAGRGPRACA